MRRGGKPMGRWAVLARRRVVPAWRGLVPISCSGARLRGGLCSALGILLLAGAVAAQEYAAPRQMGLPDPGFVAPEPDALRHTLPNGLVGYVVRDALVPLVRHTALIGAGSADGAGGAAYAAVLRSGPPSMSAAELHALLRRTAALFEVEQGFTETRVTIEVPRADAAAGLQLLAALLRKPPSPAATTADAAASASAAASGESGPVLYEGSLAAAVGLLERELFAGHPYGGDFPAGAPASAAEFAARYVVPANVVLAISGDLDPEAVGYELRTVFGDWEGAAPALVTHPAAPGVTTRQVSAYPVDKLQGWVALGHALPPVPLEDEAPLLVMNYILGGGHFDTRLFRATRDRRGLTNDDSGFPRPGFRGPGIYDFRTYGRPEAVRLLIHLTLGEIERIRAEPVSEEELFVARGALADGDYSLWFRTGAATATTYAREWLRSGDHGRSASFQARVRAVTAEQVLDAARRYLHPERMRIVVVGPIDAIRAAPAMEDEPSLEDLDR